MALTNAITVNNCLNRAAAEVGIEPVADPFGSTDAKFVKMVYLLQTAGEELVEAFQWEFLQKSHQITTVAGQSAYPLPDDFTSFIQQTGWEHNENVPLGGPLSAQDWTYLKGRDLAQNTLYASYRIAQGQFNLYPDPPPVGLDVNFEYISNQWVIDHEEPTLTKDAFTSGQDIIMFHKTLITRYLKVKWLEAGGFDTTKAQDDFSQMFAFLTGKDKGGQIINAGSSVRAYPYLGIGNLPDTGYGQ